MANGISRRHFFFGTLLAGVIPRGGFGSSVSLKALGYQSPNEKMHIAGIGAGGRALSVLGGCDSEHIVALADVDWAGLPKGMGHPFDHVEAHDSQFEEFQTDALFQT